MMDQDKEHMRILFAGFALCGAIMNKESWTPEGIWEVADMMVDTKDRKEPEEGIVAIKKRVRKV